MTQALRVSLTACVSGRLTLRAAWWGHDDAREPQCCDVFWAPVSALHPEHLSVLGPVEHARCRQLRRRQDRVRFALAGVLLRVVVGVEIGIPPAKVVIDRSCELCGQPHGRPRLPGTGLHASISHSAEYVAVAMTEAGPVGIDIEKILEVDYEPLLSSVCAPSERRHLRGSREFYTYWTRKESALKATGDGLSLPMTDIRVTPPRKAPTILQYRGARSFHAQMVDVSPTPGYAGAVTVLSSGPVRVRPRDAEAMLSSVGARSGGRR